MENWSEKKEIKPPVITPTLHYSNTPKSYEIINCHDELPSFGL